MISSAWPAGGKCVLFVCFCRLVGFGSIYGWQGVINLRSISLPLVGGDPAELGPQRRRARALMNSGQKRRRETCIEYEIW